MLGLKGTLDFWDKLIVSENSKGSGKYHDDSDSYYFVFVCINGAGSVEYEINPNVEYTDWGEIGLVIFGVLAIFLRFALLIVKSLLKRKNSAKTQLDSVKDN
jgi:hypothetical protein